jgi:hypothetical protein
MSSLQTEITKPAAGGANPPAVPWYRLDASLGISRGEAVIASTSTVGGAIIGWAVSAVFAAPEKIELWAVVAISTVATLTCLAIGSFLTAFQKEGRSRLDILTNTLNTVQRTVTQSIDRHAVLIPREEIYPEMARCVRDAEHQVVVITYFMYDWENDKRTFEPAVKGGVPGVDEFYDAIYACIERPEIEYLRLWQVPAERISEAREKIMQDPRLKKEIDLIEQIAPDHPECCRVRIIAEATTASLILVDQKTLFFNIDLYDKDRGTWLSPFMLMVRDARGRAFADLRRVVVKLSN